MNKLPKSAENAALHLQNSDILIFGRASQESHKWMLQQGLERI
jgi:hypothetical protein